jgi:hypothetical protein
VNECNILVPSDEGSNSQVRHHMNSVNDCVWRKIPKKNRLTNLQIQTSRCYNYIEEHSSQVLPLITKYSTPVSNRFSPLDNKYEPQEKNLGLYST